MKSLIFTIFLVLSLITSLSFGASLTTAKHFSGQLSSGQKCALNVGPSTVTSANSPLALRFTLGPRSFQLTGPSLSESTLNAEGTELKGSGVLNRQVVISSGVLDVGYETSEKVTFSVRLDGSSNVLGFQVTLQKIRNELVFGKWIEGERGEVLVFSCGI